MSKTDKTRPLRVRMKEHEPHFPRLVVDQDWGRYPWWRGELRCSCRMCHGCDWAKADNRKRRYEGRRQARNGADDE